MVFSFSFFQVYIVNADKPLAGLQRTRERVPGVQCFLEHHSGFFYILTNAPTNAISEWSGEGYYLTRCLVEDIEASNWQVLVVHNYYSPFCR